MIETERKVVEPKDIAVAYRINQIMSTTVYMLIEASDTEEEGDELIAQFVDEVHRRKAGEDLEALSNISGKYLRFVKAIGKPQTGGV